MNTAQIQRELEKIQQKVEREKQQELIKQIRQKPKSSYFKSVDREFYYNQNQKNREEFKEAGHYKPEFSLIEKKIPTQVLYDVPDVKDQIQEKLQLRQKSRDVKCCNRILRTIELQEKIQQSGNNLRNRTRFQSRTMGNNSPSQLMSPQQTLSNFNPMITQTNQNQNHTITAPNDLQNKLSSTGQSLQKQLQNLNAQVKSQRQSVKEPKILYFKQNKQFAYENIKLSSQYHLVLENDDGINPKISIQNSQVSGNGRNFKLSQSLNNSGQQSRRRQSHIDYTAAQSTRNQFRDLDEYMLDSQRNILEFQVDGLHSQERLRTSDKYIGNTELMNSINSKYPRSKEVVQYNKMLSREEHKLSGFTSGLEPSAHAKAISTSVRTALESYGYQPESPSPNINPQEIKDRLQNQRPNICVRDFNKTLSRYKRNSIYSKDGVGASATMERSNLIGSSAIIEDLKQNINSINYEKVDSGFKRLSSFRNTQRGIMKFSYEKPLKVEEFEQDSKSLYANIIRNKEGIGYLQKLLVKKGLITQKDLQA
eukprot:403340310